MYSKVEEKKQVVESPVITNDAKKISQSALENVSIFQGLGMNIGESESLS